MSPANARVASEHLRYARMFLESGRVNDAAERLRIALLLMWDPQVLHVGDSLLTVTPSSRSQWLEERAT